MGALTPGFLHAKTQPKPQSRPVVKRAIDPKSITAKSSRDDIAAAKEIAVKNVNAAIENIFSPKVKNKVAAFKQFTNAVTFDSCHEAFEAFAARAPKSRYFDNTETLGHSLLFSSKIMVVNGNMRFFEFIYSEVSPLNTREADVVAKDLVSALCTSGEKQGYYVGLRPRAEALIEKLKKTQKEEAGKEIDNGHIITRDAQNEIHKKRINNKDNVCVNALGVERYFDYAMLRTRGKTAVPAGNYSRQGYIADCELVAALNTENKRAEQLLLQKVKRVSGGYEVLLREGKKYLVTNKDMAGCGGFSNSRLPQKRAIELALMFHSLEERGRGLDGYSSSDVYRLLCDAKVFMVSSDASKFIHGHGGRGGSFEGVDVNYIELMADWRKRRVPIPRPDTDNSVYLIEEGAADFRQFLIENKDADVAINMDTQAKSVLKRAHAYSFVGITDKGTGKEKFWFKDPAVPDIPVSLPGGKVNEAFSRIIIYYLPKAADIPLVQER